MVQPPSPAAFETMLRLTEFEQMESVFLGWQGRIEQISSGSFEGTLQVVSGDGVRAVSARGNQRLRAQGRDSAGMLAIYPICEQMAQFQWNRASLEPGQVFVIGPDDETDVTSDRRFSGQVLFLSPDKLESVARLMRGTDGPPSPRLSGVSTPSPTMFSELRGRLDRLFQMAGAAESAIETPERRQLEQHCLLTLTATILPDLKPPKLSATGRARLLSRAKELLRGHLDGQLGIIDLCQTLDVSDRTLRMAFQEQYGIGPMTYFRFLRLNAVRSRLRADPEIAIADAAYEFGFHHLGNFAAQYRRLFGSLPSDIRRR